MSSDIQLDPHIEKMDRVSENIVHFLSKQNEEELPFKPTSTKLILLRTLSEKEKCTVNELSARTGLTSGATTLALNRLDREGLIQRIRDSSDRRVVWVKLTECGQALVKNILLRRQEMWGQILKVLTQQEKEIFIQLMDKIHDELKQSTHPPSF
ncbi:MarR family winged helix-turn-helix transcriptional regulator [Desmospora profundinema]|uniref:DNA-binding MarR family transcriptional regulator n=1 Tax=Desmospora profundinema TaxID=1571184 RepID=A0ABU1ISQ6_9BACL|nr:MarR family transcriptional regulator [Desmospora profundinema]MDR6227478.1 DNA-binding MarR family transcriptional regulator [Desmospora profundinema]